jgi:sugar lactone lactonase YvrE
MRHARIVATTLAVIAIAGFPATARAHPGSGIVVDRAGNVYFVRAGQSVVWKLSPDGRVTKLVEDDIVRLPHHLTLGRDGTLYMASDFDGRIWRVGADGALSEQFNSNRIPGTSTVNVGSWGDPWTIDSAGNVYALSAPGGSAIVRITPNGTVTPIARNTRLGELHASTMTLGGDGALYLTDANRVWRIVGDRATAIAPRGVPLDGASGIAVAADGSMYVADFQSRRVIRIARDGAVTTPPALAGIALSYPWGVTVAPDGSVYVLDHLSGGRGVAIWRVRGDVAERLYSAREASVYLAAALTTLIPLIFALRTFERKPTGTVDWFLWTILAGGCVVVIYWFGRGTVIFSWLRHLILAFFLFSAWRSWRRRPSGGE